MKQNLNLIESKIFELSYKIGLKRFCKENKIENYKVREIRKKAKKLGLFPKEDINKKYIFTEEERYNFLIELEYKGIL